MTTIVYTKLINSSELLSYEGGITPWWSGKPGLGWVRRLVGRSAQAGAQRTAIGIIILLASLMIGAIVFSQLGNQAKDIATSFNDSQAQEFVNDAQSTGYNALQMLEIGAVVMGAVFVLGLLGVLGGGDQGAI